MATRTVRQLIEKSLKLIHVYSAGDTTESSDSALGLEVLQDKLASLVNEGLMIPYETLVTHTLSSGTDEYTIGGSGDISATRPELINMANIRYGTVDYPVDIINAKEYSRVEVNSIQTRPYKLYYQPTMPNGTITLYPTPDAAYILRIRYYVNFTNATNLTNIITTDLGIPAEYYDMLSYLVATELAVMYDVDEPRIAAEASRQLDTIRAHNAARRVPTASFDELRSTDSRTYFNWRGYGNG
jgi:hypothetical protein